MSIYQPVDNSTRLRDKIYSNLEELIASGLLSPGQRLVESHLARELAVSRGPVREALQLLEADGWVEIRPRQGTYVRRIQEKELSDYFDARILIEAEAARTAARRLSGARQLGNSASESLARIVHSSKELSSSLPRDAVDASKTLEDLDKSRLYRRNSQEFHLEIANLSGNEALPVLLDFLNKRTRGYFSSSIIEERIACRIEHERIAENVVIGNEEAAFLEMKAHMERMKMLSMRSVAQG